MKLLCVLFLLCLPITGSLAAQPDYSPLVGSYHGQVFHGDDLDPITTTFSVVQGHLRVHYVVTDEIETLEGILSNPRIIGSNVFLFEWTDKFGEGLVEMHFSDDLKSFDGYWSDRINPQRYQWTGKRK